MNLEQFKARFITETSTTRERTMHTGNAFWLANAYELPEVEGFSEKELWADGPYRRVWICYEQRAILTFCEGDITVEEYATEGGYAEAVAKADEFYRKIAG